jgi:hypothetical protein
MKMLDLLPYLMIAAGNTVVAVYILFEGITPSITGTLFWTLIIDMATLAITAKYWNVVISSG